MIQKGFMTMKTTRDSKETRYGSMASKSILYLGVVILISALIYMIANFAEADTIIGLWLPFMVAGVFLVFVSQLIRRKYVRFQK